MNFKVKDIIKSFSYTISSNLISLIITSLVVLIVPKLIGVEEYGYWQLYLFYSSYVGVLHFGWNDGIYLRYGGKEYKDLDKKLMFSQFISLLILQSIIAAIIIFYSLFVNEINKDFIIQMVAINLIIVNIRILFLYILQATNRIKEYAKLTMFDRISYIIIILLMLAVGIRAYKLMIIADLFAKVLSLIFAIYSCKEIINHKLSDFYFDYKETMLNISVGIKLMFANLASNLIIGVVRFGIERSWDVATFGKISLTLSISHFMMIFINAIGIIMFPLLRRTDRKKLPDIYGVARDILMPITLAILIFYYPLKMVLSEWLPSYSESLNYVALLFPMVLFEGKIALLINTYLKSLRKERTMLKINLITLGLSIILTVLTTIYLKSLTFSVLIIVIVQAFRAIFAEIYLSRVLGVNVIKDISLEVALTVVFVFSGWYIDSWISVLIYGLSYFIYILLKRQELQCTFKRVKAILRAYKED